MQNAVGRSLVAAAAASLCFITASSALPVTDAAPRLGKPLVLVKATKTKHVAKKSAHLRHHERKVAKNGSKAVAKPTAQPASATKQPADQANSAAAAPAALSPDVANARAELTAGDPQTGAPSSTLTEADKAASAETANNGVQIAAADQLNDIDRDMTAQNMAAQDPALQDKAAQAPATPAAPVQMAALTDSQSATAQPMFSQNHAWSGASLIGKIFIGIGAMLTLASAARMLIA